MASKQDDEVEAARVGAGTFPRAVPEDHVEYCIYYRDEGISDIQRRDKLRQIQAAGAALIKKHLKEYIWEQDSFSLNLAKQDGTSHLQGQAAYGDSVEDEWLIVWLLVEISKQFEHAWIRVADADGEFLLIEAANVLPRWLNPEIADNRVWINQGHLHIIPKTSDDKASASQYAGSLTLAKALNFVSKGKSKLLSDTKIETEAFFRIKKYPTGIADSLHHALVRVPRRVAFLLDKKPTYISAAIEAFYLRDPIALKPLQATTPQGLLFPPNDLVTSRVRFTRIGFAKVRSQQFPFPPSWDNVSRDKDETSKAFFQAEMGMKLTCGFEMLLSDKQNKDKKVVREINIILEDLEAGEENLPIDMDIAAWGTTEDDDKWLDIDYQDFEQELAGQGTRGSKNSGFGDTEAQERLQKMVSRFEDLMADDDDELDEMDEDNDSDAEGANSDAESTNSAEEDFTKMMMEMLDMSRETLDELMGKMQAEPAKDAKGKGPQVIDADSDDDEEEIRQLSQAMEAELRASGALKLDTIDKKDKKKAVKSSKVEDIDDDESGDEELLDEDYNLAKNMLEAFKSQGGNAGPAGNLMSMLGVGMPRDEDDSD